VIPNDESKAADLEKQLHDLRMSIVERKTKIDHKSSAFTSAAHRRNAEIDQLQQQFAAVNAK
jgi:hypothetical protein